MASHDPSKKVVVEQAHGGTGRRQVMPALLFTWVHKVCQPHMLNYSAALKDNPGMSAHCAQQQSLLAEFSSLCHVPFRLHVVMLRRCCQRQSCCGMEQRGRHRIRWISTQPLAHDNIRIMDMDREGKHDAREIVTPGVDGLKNMRCHETSSGDLLHCEKLWCSRTCFSRTWAITFTSHGVPVKLRSQ